MKLIFKIVLFPFAVLYGLIIRLRHWCYNVGIFKVHTFAVPTICVGNIAVGGTGKSPMVEYLIQKFQNRHKVAVLSRGYKRKTKGFLLADKTSTVLDLGDEPFQFWQKYKDIILAVCANRVEGIQKICSLSIKKLSKGLGLAMPVTKVKGSCINISNGISSSLPYTCWL